MKRGIRGLAVAATFLVACGGHGGGKADMPDPGMVDAGPATLSLSIRLKPPEAGGDLALTGGQLEFKRISVFGDIAADDRTMATAMGLPLPDGQIDDTFDQAPYGLYSRVQIRLDDIHIRGTWKNSPLSVNFEGEALTADLRSDALDYEPTSGVHFSVVIDSNGWFDSGALDAAVGAGTPSGITVDYFNNQTLIPGIASGIFNSFALADAPADGT